MRFRKWMAAGLCLCLLISALSGCSGQKTPQTSTPAATTAEQGTVPDTTAVPGPVGEETFLLREEGTKQLTLYWKKAGADIATSDVWMWWDGKDGEGYLFCPCEYGFKCQVNVPETVEEVGFIVRTGCSEPGGKSWGNATKDFEDDRYAVLEGEETVIYLKSGDGDQYHSSDGGKTLETVLSFTIAGIVSANEIYYTIKPAARLTKDDITVYEDGVKKEIASLSSDGNKVVGGTIRMAAPLDISHNYQVEIKGYGTLTAVPTDYFDTPEFIAEYIYDGDDLGAVVGENGTTFKLWAPTSSEVVLNLYEKGDGGEAFFSFPMDKGEKGVWSLSVPYGHGTYYTYTVTNSAGTNEVVDPYAKAAGVNGNRGMIVDLSQTDPEGFSADRFVALKSYADAVIWEVHVRDFSNKLPGSKYPGKYLAFTEEGLVNASGVPVGLDYITGMQFTHVHLQPVYDFATIDESSSEPQFNWGYDPKNYNVPEGSYSTDPFHGEVRILEFKQMVQALHSKNTGVVMDVVYNHTYDANSNFNRIVPYYYYRYYDNGANANGSGCGNETASDRAMFRKFMVDSVRYWATEYHIDGFRFDLMALHDLTTMQQIEETLHAVNPSCIIYGEGWTGGSTPLPLSEQANQRKIGDIKASAGAAGSIAVFNDAIRDGLKGSVFDVKDCGYISGKVTMETAEKVGFGLTGGAAGPGATWSVPNGMVINYMSCHDNLTLWDKLELSCPDATEEERIAMNRLGAAIVMLSKGTPFFLAGEEMLRSKGGDENSYKSSDDVNNIDWELLKTGSSAMATASYYYELIALRRDNAFLRQADVSYEVVENGILVVSYQMNGKTVAKAYINPFDKASDMTLSGTLLWGEDKTLGARSVRLMLEN